MPRKYGRKVPSSSATSVELQSAIVIVDFNKEMFRWLFQALYKAVLDQAEVMGDSEEAVKAKFMALLANDPQHVFIVELLGETIQSHCLYRAVDNDIIIEQFCGTKEFINSVLQTIENETEVANIHYSVDESNVDYFLDECGFEVKRVNIVKTFHRD